MKNVNPSPILTPGCMPKEFLHKENREESELLSNSQQRGIKYTVVFRYCVLSQESMVAKMAVLGS